MPTPETTILDESAVSEIEARAGDKWTVNTDTIRALCATVKHLRAEVRWCNNCGSKDIVIATPTVLTVKENENAD